MQYVKSDFMVAKEPNARWSMHACDSIYNIDQVFIKAAIRDSIVYSQRYVYYVLDHTWLNQILEPDVAVEVYCHNATSLMQSPTRQTSSDNFEIIILHLPRSSFKPSRYTAGIIDDFLVSNPCYTLLSEPKWIEDYYENRSKYVLPNDVISELAILVKFPNIPLGPTCQFFNHITERQFPDECPSSSSSLYYYQVTQFGFGGELHKILKTFGFMLSQYDSKIYANFVEKSGRWVWANESTCTADIYKNNPWACSFLPFSKCNAVDGQLPDSGDQNDKDNGWGQYNPKTLSDSSHATLRVLNITSALLLEKQDGIAFAHEPALWATFRLYAFVLRPNSYTRYLIRKASAHFIKVLGHDSHNRNIRQVGNSPSINILSHHSVLNSQCVGLHVRNGDVLSDFRSDRAIDRSLNAHVYAAINFTKEMSIFDIFLASDNRTLFRIAPLEYPSFRWYGQLRKISEYGRNTRHNPHWHEDDTQKEIANILTDALAISTCRGLVGQGDGSITFMYWVYGCMKHPQLTCPLFFDMQSLHHQGEMPYIGARRDKSTYATFSMG